MRYRAPGERPDDNPAEQFLVDGVSPAVIGEGPPELTPPETDWAGDGRHARPEAPYQPQVRREPPTDRIPAQQPADPQEPKQRKGLLARVFRLR